MKQSNPSVIKTVDILRYAIGIARWLFVAAAFCQRRRKLGPTIHINVGEPQRFYLLSIPYA